MSDYLTDEEQLDKLKKWWEDNGLMLVGAVVVSVAGVIGWNWYGERRDAAIASSSDLYVDYLRAEGTERETIEATLASEQTASHRFEHQASDLHQSPGDFRHRDRIE